jgi:hypothetical protein
MSLAVHHVLRIRVLPCAVVAFGCALGCIGPLTHDLTHRPPTSDHDVVSVEASYPQPLSDSFPTNTTAAVESTSRTYGPPTAEEARVALPIAAAASPTVDDTKALGEALAELHSQGTIDSATQVQLLEGLQQTDPALWPQLLTYFRSAAVTRREPAKIAPAPETKLASATEPRPATPTPEPPAATEPVEEKSEKPASPAKPTKKTKKGKAAKAAKTASDREASDTSKPEPQDDDWQQQLAASIAKLEKQTSQAPTSNTEIGQHAGLRIMYLAAGRREDALKPIEGIPPAQQDFWSKELYGLAAYLDHARNPDASRRAAEANSHFREATARLSELATLQVRNLAFCTEVTNYGVYKPFETAEFQAGQELLLYAEIENFKSEHADRGHHTALKASYQILDERGARVDEKEFALTEEYCQNPRRDFFIRYFIWMPQRIYGGTYTLQLSVEDTLSQKIGQASIEFKIKGK